MSRKGATTQRMEFVPVPTLAPLFHATPEDKYLFVLGPIGSTKTTTVLMWLLMRAATQAPSPDGIRRTRFALVRNTLASLVQTVLKDIRSLFGPIATWHPSDKVIRIAVGDIESEWLLMPMETPEDQRRLLSLQLTGVYINEVREVDWGLVMAAFSRTGRFPSAKHGQVECSYRFLIADSNMGVEGSDMYKFLEEERPDSLLYIRQPSALSPQADWHQYLPKGYYQDAMVGASKQWINQHVKAQWGLDLSGEPVYGAAFDEDIHVAEKPLRVLPDRPLIIGVDPGLNPAVVIGQIAHNGQLRLLRELHSPNILFRPFLTEHVIPMLRQPGFWQLDMQFIMDPAGRNRHAMSKDTAFGVMAEYDLEVVTAQTNDIEPRIRSVERWLVEMRGSEPALQVDPTCTQIIEGFRGRYRYLRDRKLQLASVPEKKHPISDVHDCVQYICMGLSKPRMARRMGASSGRGTGFTKESPSKLGWT